MSHVRRALLPIGPSPSPSLSASPHYLHGCHDLTSPVKYLPPEVESSAITLVLTS